MTLRIAQLMRTRAKPAPIYSRPLWSIATAVELAPYFKATPTALAERRAVLRSGLGFVRHALDRQHVGRPGSWDISGDSKQSAGRLDRHLLTRRIAGVLADLQQTTPREVDTETTAFEAAVAAHPVQVAALQLTGAEKIAGFWQQVADRYGQLWALLLHSCEEIDEEISERRQAPVLALGASALVIASNLVFFSPINIGIGFAFMLFTSPRALLDRQSDRTDPHDEAVTALSALVRRELAWQYGGRHEVVHARAVPSIGYNTPQERLGAGNVHEIVCKANPQLVIRPLLSGSGVPVTWIGIDHWLTRTAAGEPLLNVVARRAPTRPRYPGKATEGLQDAATAALSI